MSSLCRVTTSVSGETAFGALRKRLVATQQTPSWDAVLKMRSVRTCNVDSGRQGAGRRGSSFLLRTLGHPLGVTATNCNACLTLATQVTITAISQWRRGMRRGETCKSLRISKFSTVFCGSSFIISNITALNHHWLIALVTCEVADVLSCTNRERMSVPSFHISITRSFETWPLIPLELFGSKRRLLSYQP